MAEKGQELWEACKAGDLEKVKELSAQKDVDVDWANPNENNRTGLAVACAHGHLAIVQCLMLTREALRVNKREKNGRTPFFTACFCGQTDIVEVMLGDRRVNVDVGDSDGRTPLWCACQAGAEEVVKLLLASGRIFNVSKKPVGLIWQGNTTAAEVARMEGFNSIADLVEQYSRDPRETAELLRTKLDIADTELDLHFGLRVPWCCTTTPSPWGHPSKVGSLVLDECEKLQDDEGLKKMLQKMGDFSNVVGLYLGRTNFSRFPIDAISKFKRLRALHLLGSRGVDLGKFAQVLNKSQVRLVDFSDTRFVGESNPVEFIRATRNLSVVNFRGCSLNAADALRIIQVLLHEGRNSYELILIDGGIKLETFEGLESLPKEIKEESALNIITYVLDLLQQPKEEHQGQEAEHPEDAGQQGTSDATFIQTRTPSAAPAAGPKHVYRSKLMVVGYERVGKTSLLEAMFPSTWSSASSTTASPPQPVFLVLTGKTLAVTTEQGQATKELNLAEGGTWFLTTSTATVGTQEVKLGQKDKAEDQFSFTFSDEQERQSFVDKVQRVISDARTHGIDIQQQEIPQPQLGDDASLELSVWDFGGQHDYYNNHHHFLSSRSIFLVVWNVTEGSTGIAGLEFWLRSLQAHLPPLPPNEKPDYSIIVVGTHVDKLINPNDTRALREAELGELFGKTFQKSLPFEYIEVSSKTRTNLGHLHTRIIDTVLGHSYMGEVVPASYLKVEQAILQMRAELRERGELPLLELDRFLEHLRSIDPDLSDTAQHPADTDGANPGVPSKARRAINLLHSWGVCVHFEPGEEAVGTATSAKTKLQGSYIVLEPAFLTQQVMAQLFHPDYATFFPTGVLPHKFLKLIWAKFADKAEFLLALMERFEVCFELPSEDPDFWNRSSLITAYLPASPPKELAQRWAEQCPAAVNQFARIYTFNLIPRELISRLLVRLHRRMEEKFLWKSGLLLETDHVQVLIRVGQDASAPTLEVTCRGADLETARLILHTIAGEIEEASQKYAGIRSTCMESATKEAPQSPWWQLDPDQSWENRGMVSLLPIFKDGQVLVAPLWEKLKFAMQTMGGNWDRVTDAFAIANPVSFQGFEAHRAMVGAKQTMTPTLFDKRTWKEKPKAGEFQSKDERDWPNPLLRQEVFDVFRSHVDRFNWNTVLKCPVGLYAQGTSAAWNIAEAGFGIVAGLDEGWFGKGIYFTGALKYAEKYAELSASGNPQRKPSILIAAVATGNPFPVIAHPDNPLPFKGRPCQAGYQSHFTVVDLETFQGCYPLEHSGKERSNAVDELVTFETTQSLPLFLVRLKPSEKGPDGKDLLRHFQVICEGRTSVFSIETPITSIDFLVAALQQHLKVPNRLAVAISLADGSFLTLVSIDQLPENCDQLHVTKFVGIPAPPASPSSSSPASQSAVQAPSSSASTLQGAQWQGVISLDDFIELEPDGVIATLKAAKIKFPPKVEQIITDQYLDGSALAKMTVDSLKGLEIPAGPATNIAAFVAQLK